MSIKRFPSINYTAVPADFPYNDNKHPSERCLDWNVCEELALHLAGECVQARARAERSERPIDILLRFYRLVESRGWGEPPLLRWVFRRVAGLLGWPVPHIARHT